MDNSEATVIAGQFGPRASAYVTSKVHAEGPDLERMAELASQGQLALDLGCGGGHVAFAFAAKGSKVIAYDLSPEMLEAVDAEAARRNLTNIETRLGEVEALPFEDATFDLVATRFSAHHWGDLRQGLKEARRVAKFGATGLFSDVVGLETPRWDSALQALEIIRDPSHARNATPSVWLASLGASGFAVQRATFSKLPIEFKSWTERMSVPRIQVEAILDLQRRLPESTRRALEIQEDGSFVLNVALFETIAV